MTNSEDMRAGKGRTLVFTKNVAAANAAYQCLYDEGVDVMLYHRDVLAEGRAKALAIMGRRAPYTLACCPLGASEQEVSMM